MIWNVPEIIAQLSSQYELCPGDIILTGTPAGVGPLVPEMWLNVRSRTGYVSHPDRAEAAGSNVSQTDVACFLQLEIGGLDRGGPLLDVLRNRCLEFLRR